MSTDRRVSLIDRWGVEIDEEVTLDRFAALYDDLDAEDDEHCVVDICDEKEWYVEFSLTTVAFGNAEAGGDVGSLPLADRSSAITVAAEFLSGDFEALRLRPWA